MAKIDEGAWAVPVPFPVPHLVTCTGWQIGLVGRRTGWCAGEGTCGAQLPPSPLSPGTPFPPPGENLRDEIASSRTLFPPFFLPSCQPRGRSGVLSFRKGQSEAPCSPSFFLSLSFPYVVREFAEDRRYNAAKKEPRSEPTLPSLSPFFFLWREELAAGPPPFFLSFPGGQGQESRASSLLRPGKS